MEKIKTKQHKKRNLKYGYYVIFLFITVFFSLIFLQLKKWEHTGITENNAIKSYRNQTFSCTENLKENKAENQKTYNTENINKNQIKVLAENQAEELLDLVDIILLQSTNDKASLSFIQKNLEILYNGILLTKKEQNFHSKGKENISEPKGKEKSPDRSLSSDINCILNIPSIHLEKPVFNKNTNAYLKNYYLVTAYDDMDFSEGGTFIIYGHNSYVKNLSFQNLPDIHFNDSIFIECMNQEFEFFVKEIKTVNPEQISEYFVQEENKIVLVACTNQSTKQKPEYLVVVAKK